jgi:hypothetical protein
MPRSGLLYSINFILSPQNDGSSCVSLQRTIQISPSDKAIKVGYNDIEVSEVCTTL